MIGKGCNPSLSYGGPNPFQITDTATSDAVTQSTIRCEILQNYTDLDLAQPYHYIVYQGSCVAGKCKACDSTLVTKHLNNGGAGRRFSVISTRFSNESPMDVDGCDGLKNYQYCQNDEWHTYSGSTVTSTKHIVFPGAKAKVRMVGKWVGVGIAGLVVILLCAFASLKGGGGGGGGGEERESRSEKPQRAERKEQTQSAQIPKPPRTVTASFPAANSASSPSAPITAATEVAAPMAVAAVALSSNDDYHDEGDGGRGEVEMTATGASALPAGWEEAYDEKGSLYYYCPATNETSWERPGATSL